MIEQLAKDLFQQIQDTSENLKGAKAETEKQMQMILERTLNKFNLVTRAEFDTQEAILLRTRERLEALEKQLDALLKERDSE